MSMTNAQRHIFMYLRNMDPTCWLGEFSDVFYGDGRAIYDAFQDIRANSVAEALACLTHPYGEPAIIQREFACLFCGIELRDGERITCIPSEFFYWSKHPERGYTVLQLWQDDDDGFLVKREWPMLDIRSYLDWEQA